MERESNLHSPLQDDEMKAEIQGMLKGNGPTRAEEWRETEPMSDDDEETETPDRNR